MINLKLNFVMCSSFLTILNVVHAEEAKSTLSVAELKYLAPEIREAEKRVHNIKIESEAWSETKSSLYNPNESWQRTPTYISATSWLNVNSSKTRVDFHKEVLKWKNGPAPFLEKNYSAIFDGQKGAYIKNSISHSEQTFHINKVSILTEIPHQLKSRWYQKMIGLNASLIFHFRNEEEMFSSQLQNITDPNFNINNAELSAAFQTLRGIECINISKKGKRFRKNYWLDPNRGYALLKLESLREDSNGNEVLSYSIDVRKLDKVAENIWWPMEVYFVNAPFGVGNPWDRICYRATKIVANNPNFDDSIFTLTIPEGYLVDEAEYKTVYTNPTVGQ